MRRPVIARALAQARIDTSAISYIEAHGTGTPLGDPIEIAGLSKAYQSAPRSSAPSDRQVEYRTLRAASALPASQKCFCRCALSARALAARGGTQSEYRFLDHPFTVQRTLSDWRRTQASASPASHIRRGGSNAHIIVEEYPQTDTTSAANEPALIVLSAQSAERLRESAAHLRDHLTAPLADIAHTLRIGARQWSTHRFCCDTRRSLARRSTHAGRCIRCRGRILGSATGTARAQRFAIILPSWRTGEALRNRRLEDLARLWTSGAHIDWTRLDATSLNRRA